MKNKHYIYISLFLLSIGFFYTCKNSSGEQEKDNSIYVKTLKLKEKSHKESIRATGRLSTTDELKLSFKTGGIIESIVAGEGLQVNKGRILASLKMNEIEAKANQARLAMEKAQRDLQRAKNLYNDSVATLEQYQNAKTAFELARANYQIAGFNLKHSVITAPEDGKILKQLAETGEMIAPGHPLFLFGSTNKQWKVKVAVTDKDIVKIKKGDSAKINLGAYPEKKFKGIVSETGTFADPYTGTFEVEIKLSKINVKLVSGIIAKVEIQSSEIKHFFEIPAQALIEGNENIGYVYQYNEKKPKRIRVGIEKITDNGLLINSGLKNGMKIITEGVNYVKPNSRIIETD